MASKELCRRTKFMLAVGLMVWATAGWGQAVYKCGAKGAVVYSHEPCLGAQVIDTTPTQGLDKSSGQSRKGADVARSEQNKAMADGLRPLLGESLAQREQRHRRARLTASEHAECEDLDRQLPVSEAARRGSKGVDAGQRESVLLEQRQRYRELRC